MNVPTDSRAAAVPETKTGAAPQHDPQGYDAMKHTPLPTAGQRDFIHDGVVRFTPAMAAKVIREHSYEKNRDVSRSPKHVDVLAETMRRGEWLPKDQIAFARLDGNLTLINGHHRMHAQVAASCDVEWSIAIYDCVNADQLAALYARFDTNTKVRSDENVIASYGLAERIGVQNTTARGLWRAIPIIANGLVVGAKQQIDNHYIRRMSAERLAVALEYASEAREYEKAIAASRGKVKRRLLTGGIMAMGMVTLKHHLSTGYRFWEGVAENDGLRRGDPRLAFVNYLMEADNNRGLQSQPVFAAAKCWNAYVHDKDMQLIRISGNAINVAGTPYWVSP